MNLVEQKAHIVQSSSRPRIAGIFHFIADKPAFAPINRYDLNDLMYDKLAWMPEALSIDSKELVQVNIRTVPMSRMADGNLWVMHENIRTYWPDLNDAENSYGAIHEMIHAATINHVMSWGLDVQLEGLRSQQRLGYDQLRENFDMIVVGVGLDEREDHKWSIPRTTKHLTITVVLLLTADFFRLVKRQTENAIVYCDNHLKEKCEPGEEVGLEDPFFDYVRAEGFDTTVLLMPGAE